MTELKYVVKALVLNSRGEVLILRRSSTDSARPHDWDLPGGGIDPGEEPGQAVLREIAEEVSISLTADAIRLIGKETTQYGEPRNHVVLRFLYNARVDDNTTVSLSYEHDQFEWLPLEAALERIKHLVWGELALRARAQDVLQS